MATVYATFGSTHLDTGRKPKDIFVGDTVRSEAITSSGTTASGALTAAANDTVLIYCATAVYANTGLAPTASAATGAYVAAGEYYPLAIRAGHKVAVIDV